MDVVLTPIKTEVDVWSVKDRLGRNLGTVVKGAKADTFRVKSEPGSALRAVKVEHASLNDAMSAIAKLMNGACNLDSQQWD